jgi:hypothetical protein
MSSKIMRSKYLIAMACGGISGIASTWLPEHIGKNTFVWLPGAVFGLVFACYAVWATRSVQIRFKYLIGILFIGLSTAAYYSAVFVFGTSLDNFGFDKTTTWVPGILAGFAGSLLLVLSVWVCSLTIPSWRHSIMTILFGGIFGSFIMFDTFLKGYLLFVLWQTVVFVSLVSVFPKDLLEDA